MNITTSPAPSGQHTRFRGSDQYVATDDLKLTVNASMTLQWPLLIKGESGTGKTMLAEEVVVALGMPLLRWYVKSATKVQRGLYEYDTVSCLRDSQLGDDKVYDIRSCIIKGVSWQAFGVDELVMLLIDEIGRADIELPNDLLRELDCMKFHVYKTRETIRAKHRPLATVASSNEKELPDMFLHRCFFHYIKFPDVGTIQAIADMYYPGIKPALIKAMLDAFYEMRNLLGLKKKPSTSELVDWLRLLPTEDIPPEPSHSQGKNAAILLLHGALLKNKQDAHLFKRLVFVNRADR